LKRRRRPMTETYTHISLEYSFQKRIATLTMRRPEVHNAFNTHMIQELLAAFTDLSADEQLHAVVLTGEGRSFSAGADIKMMQETATLTEEQNLNDALQLADLMYTINALPCPVVARVNGAALGGGVGLIATSDIAIAVESARFAFSEVKLGVAPAVISPYVVRKIGETHARGLFVTGERFSAERALRIGLIHGVVPQDYLDDAVQKALNELLNAAPQAIRAGKTLALNVAEMTYEQARHYTAQMIAHLRVGKEGREGLAAFLEKREPSWKTQPEEIDL
jgi:methylglutaconyl-CoA hydratase